MLENRVLRMLENRVLRMMLRPKRWGSTGACRNLCIEVLYIL
jgi:hypothetical protein